ncbi:hypothetical protein SKAU_G00230920 [Synaphobranchus kaupii]|uniref:Uncharacterized protein n=1 Tax=Synaphobranchus kaupii TaxID=118154 RepID=A0A9Q1F5M7_SYNKA|nr:hypothetical protein SKAU_G00230920 [Synaphobranchus kaupii]
MQLHCRSRAHFIAHYYHVRQASAASGLRQFHLLPSPVRRKQKPHSTRHAADSHIHHRSSASIRGDALRTRCEAAPLELKAELK